MTKGILLSLILVCLWVITHIVVVQVFRPARIFKTSTSIFLGTIPLFFVLFLSTPANLYVLPDSLAQTSVRLGLFNGLIVHLLLYGTWWHVFYPIERALTIGILIAYLEAADSRLTNKELHARYSFEGSLEKRLDDMRLNGYATPDLSGRYDLTDRGRSLTRFFMRVRRIFQVPFYLLDERRRED